MEQELRFGLDLGRLALLKKKYLGRLLATFEAYFFKFSWGKRLNQKHCKAVIK